MNIKTYFLLFCIGFSGVLTGQTESVNGLQENLDPATVLWFNQPATVWDEALPVGNGRLGGMVYGKNEEEIIQFNEDTYYSGGPYSTVVKGGHKKLAEIQNYLFNDEPIKAHKLFGRELMGYPVEQMKYQSMANLHLFFDKAPVTNYRRSLDLETGIATVQYRMNGVNYTREVFASVIDQTIIHSARC